MKSTGITRRVDELGRIVLPIELRRTLGVEERDSLEIFVDNDTIVLRKYNPGCVLCGSVDNVNYYHGSPVCAECEKMISQHVQQPLK